MQINLDGNNKFPYPFKANDISDEKWLACHPGGFAHGTEINVMGRNSFITAYGSTIREDVNKRVR